MGGVGAGGLERPLSPLLVRRPVLPVFLVQFVAPKTAFVVVVVAVAEAIEAATVAAI